MVLHGALELEQVLDLQQQGSFSAREPAPSEADGRAVKHDRAFQEAIDAGLLARVVLALVL